jgi:hypothetical protein
MPESKKPSIRHLLEKLLEARINGDEERVHELALACEFGREPRPGHVLARTIFGKVFEEAEGTPYYCSPQSETYWCS